MIMNWERTLAKAGMRQRILLLAPFLLLSSLSPSVLQSYFKRSAVFGNCKKDLVIEEDSASHVLGVSWKLKFTNQGCKWEKEKAFYPDDPGNRLIVNSNPP